MRRKINMMGKRFDRLLVVAELPERKHKEILWLCKCDCGEFAKVTGYNLRISKTKSCGCLRKDLATKDLTGKKFGKLTANHVADYRMKNLASNVWVCDCSCGGTIDVATSQLINGNTKSCGCTRIAFLKARIGDKHHRYNSYLTQEERKRRRGSEHDTWSKNVLIRDNYTCRVCNERGKRLAAHHLDGYNWCKERRSDIDNGVTLCKKCHTAFHKIYGYGNNTEEQFYEFHDIQKLRGVSNYQGEINISGNI